jgi:hypothetical protein
MHTITVRPSEFSIIIMHHDKTAILEKKVEGK